MLLHVYIIYNSKQKKKEYKKEIKDKSDPIIIILLLQMCKSVSVLHKDIKMTTFWACTFKHTVQSAEHR